MSVRVEIIGDGSFNKDLRLGGYAGRVYIRFDGERKDILSKFNGVMAEAYNPDDVEMMAIAAGAERANELLGKLGETAGKVNIYTDNKHAIAQYALFEEGAGDHYRAYTRSLRKMHKQLPALKAGGDFNMDYVKAHVDDAEATPLEKLHNTVDRKALDVRWKAQDHIFKPDTIGSPFYGVIIPAFPSADQKHDLKQIAYAQAKQGMIARVAIMGAMDESKEPHPFLEGVRMAAKEDDRDVNDLLRQVSLQGDDNSRGYSSDSSTLDRVLLRHYAYKTSDDEVAKKNGRVPLNLESTRMRHATIASRVVYGPQDDTKSQHGTETGRLEPASQYVLNLYESSRRKTPVYAGDWMDFYMGEINNVNYSRGVYNSLKAYPTPEAFRLHDPDAKLRSLLKETVFGYHATLEPGQLKQILLSNAKQLGYGPDEDVFNAFHNAVESHFKHGPVGLLKQCNKNIMTLIEAQRKSPEIAPPSESQKKPVEGSGLRQEAKEERRTLRLGTC